MRIAGLLILVLFFPAFAHAAVVINEIMYNPQGGDTGREWIELFNSGAVSVTMTAGTSGWRISDSSKHVLVDPSSGIGRGSLSIPAGGYVIIANDPTAFSQSGEYPNGSYSVIKSAISLNNTGTTTILTDSAGTLVSSVSYTKDMGGSDDGNSLQLVSGNWIAAAPTPGAVNAGVSDSSDDSTPPDDSSDTTDTTTDTTTSSSGGPTEYLPIPTLRIITSGVRTVSSGADTAFTAAVYDGKGNKRDDATVTWSFGDGMRKTGASVFHAYYDSGEYLAIVHAVTSDGGDALSEMIITVKDASIKIVSISPRGITLANNDSRTLDLSLWRLSAGGKEFKIPENTHILAGRTTLFPTRVIQLPITDSASLLYPSGEVATTYPLISNSQPSEQKISSNTIQVVKPLAVNKEPIINKKVNVQINEYAVNAPTAAIGLAAVGAALPTSSEALPQASGTSIFKSPWTLGFIGTVILAAAAFILI